MPIIPNFRKASEIFRNRLRNYFNSYFRKQPKDSKDPDLGNIVNKSGNISRIKAWFKPKLKDKDQIQNSALLTYEGEIYLTSHRPSREKFGLCSHVNFELAQRLDGEMEEIRVESPDNVRLNKQLDIEQKMGTVYLEHSEDGEIQQYINKDYAQSKTLQEELVTTGQQMDLQKRLELAAKFIEEWQRHQEEGILHCDINPESAIVLQNGDVRWVKHGCAESLDNQPEIIKQKAEGSNPDFIAPEIGALEKLDLGFEGPQQLKTKEGGAVYSSASEAYAVGKVLGNSLGLFNHRRNLSKEFNAMLVGMSASNRFIRPVSAAGILETIKAELNKLRNTVTLVSSQVNYPHAKPANVVSQEFVQQALVPKASTQRIIESGAQQNSASNTSDGYPANWDDTAKTTFNFVQGQIATGHSGSNTYYPIRTSNEETVGYVHSDCYSPGKYILPNDFPGVLAQIQASGQQQAPEVQSQFGVSHLAQGFTSAPATLLPATHMPQHISHPGALAAYAQYTNQQHPPPPSPNTPQPSKPGIRQ